MTTGYTVRWVEGKGARHEHLDVWNRNLAMRVTPERRYEWLYCENPTGTPGRLYVLEALGEGGASEGFVGTAGYGTRAFRDGGRSLRAALMCDVAVDVGHRIAMPAFMVTTALRKHVLHAFDLAYGFPNHLSEPIVTRGYRKLGAMRRFALVLRHARHVKAKVAHPLAARGAALALDGARAALVAARAAAVARDYRLDWLVSEDVDARFDRLWEGAARDYQFIGVRDARFVRWRFLDRAEGTIALVGLVHRRTGALAGYAAVQPEGDVSHVRDVFARVRDLPALLQLLSLSLLGRGACSISLSILAPTPVIMALKGTGFRERADRRTVVCGVGKPAENIAAQLYDVKRWFLTDADEDA